MFGEKAKTRDLNGLPFLFAANWIAQFCHAPLGLGLGFSGAGKSNWEHAQDD